MNIQFISSLAHNIAFGKTFLKTLHSMNVYTVDEEKIRSSSLDLEEFTNFATYLDFPKLIPKNEIWLSESNDESENNFFIQNALKQVQLVNSGETSLDAYHKALQYEKSLREKQNNFKYKPWQQKTKTIYKSIYIKLLKSDHNLKIYLVDGNKVRTMFKTDFVEGGHGYVYNWIPLNEVWIDNDIKQDEIKFIAHHELVERHLMKKGRSYDEAHDTASKKEFEMRQN